MYIFDTNALMELFNHFYYSRFPSLWSKFDNIVESGKIISVREVKNEIGSHHNKNNLTKWANENKDLFEQPDLEEINLIKTMFEKTHFQTLIDRKKIYKGGFVADPFLVAKAKAKKGILITQEKYKENGAKIPNVCEHLNVPYLNLEGFMEKEKWQF